MMSGLFWGTIIFAILTIVGVLALGFIHPPVEEPMDEHPFWRGDEKITLGDYVRAGSARSVVEERYERHPLAPKPALIPDAYLGSPIEELAATATDEL